MVGPIVAALRSAGIQVWGWQYVYGYVDAEGQALAAIRRVREFDLDGFVVNAEGEWEGYPSEAASYMKALRSELPQFPVALSSFRFPSYHQSFPWEEFLAGCDLNMPQVYWQNHSPVADLEQSLQEHAAHQNARPVFPTGATYFMEANVPATPEQVQAFLTAAKAEGLSGANFWSWQHANGLQSDFGFNIWQTIADFDWPI